MIYENKYQKDVRAKKAVVTMNFLQFFGWCVIINTFFVHIITKKFDPKLSEKTLTITLIFLKIVQTLQISDVIFAFSKLGGGSPISSLAQITSRLLITYVFLGDIRDTESFALFLIPWCIGDAVRALYYLHKAPLIGHLRYNLFIILYPTGVSGEILLMEKSISTIEDKTNFNYLITRLVQICFILGFFILYRHVLIQRKKFYAGVEKSKKSD